MNRLEFSKIIKWNQILNNLIKTANPIIFIYTCMSYMYILKHFNIIADMCLQILKPNVQEQHCKVVKYLIYMYAYIYVHM